MAVKSKAPAKKAAKAPAAKKSAKPATAVKKLVKPASKAPAKAAKPAKSAQPVKPVPAKAVPAKAAAKPAARPAAAKPVVKPAAKLPPAPVVKAAPPRPAVKPPLPRPAPGSRPPSPRAALRSAAVDPSASAMPMPAPRPVPIKPLPVTSKQDVAAAHEYLLSRSASRSEAPVIVNGKKLPTEEQLLKMSEAEYMNEEQLAFFKYRLQQMEKELLANAGETTEHLRETVIVPDPADRATIEEEHALELRTRDRERKLLKKVQSALASIDGGGYGFCEETGEPIGIPRLLARPTATLSLEAQQRREMKQKLYGD